MSEIDDFFLINYKNKLILIFNSAEFGIKQCYLPNCSSLDSLSRQIAIETDVFENLDVINKIISEKLAGNFKIDSGNLGIVKQSRYKIKFKLLGASINQMFVMIAPSWGRWTKKHIWLIVSSKE